MSGAVSRSWKRPRATSHRLLLPGSESPETRSILRELGFGYASNGFDDDLPYWDRSEPQHPLLVVPYALDSNDMKFFHPNGFVRADEMVDYVRDAIDMLLEEGEAGHPKLLNIGWHLRIAGRPGRFAAFKRVLALLDSYGDRCGSPAATPSPRRGAASSRPEAPPTGWHAPCVCSLREAADLQDASKAKAARTLDVEDLTVRYGTSTAVDGVTLAIEPGEVVALLGPSGCGKTTLLRVIAGFVRQAAGRVRVDGTVIDHLPPNQRNIGIVFQNYALFPT